MAQDWKCTWVRFWTQSFQCSLLNSHFLNPHLLEQMERWKGKFGCKLLFLLILQSNPNRSTSDFFSSEHTNPKAVFKCWNVYPHFPFSHSANFSLAFWSVGLICCCTTVSTPRAVFHMSDICFPLKAHFCPFRYAQWCYLMKVMTRWWSSRILAGFPFISTI